MATYPVTGSSPWGPTLQSYIDAKQKLITVDDLPTTGVHSAHRSAGGGNGETYIGPDSSFSAARVAIALGYHIMDCDIQLTQDGIPVVMHDTTLDRTTNGTGNVADLPQDLLPQIDMRYMVGNGFGNTESVPTLEEWLANLGGRVILTVEPKQVPSGITVIAPMINARGLARSVLVNCLNTDTSTLNSIAAAGLLAHVYNSTTLGDITALASYTNLQIVELPYNVSAPIMAAALALPNSPRILAAPIKKRTERDAMTAGFHGYVSDSLGYLDKVTDRRDIIGEIAQQKVGVGWYNPGAATGNVSSRTFPKFGSVTNGMLVGSASPAARRDVMMGSMSGPKPGTYNVDLSFYTSGWVGDTNSRPRIRVCCPSDEGTAADSDTRGYSLGMRVKNASVLVWTAPAGYGAGVNISSIVAGLSTPDSTAITCRVRAEITPTTIAMTRLDNPIALSGSVTAGTVTSLPVPALPAQINSGTKMLLSNGQYANVNGTQLVGATSIVVSSFTLTSTLASGSPIYYSSGQLANTDWRGDYIWIGGQVDGGTNHLFEIPAAFWGVPRANLSAAVGAGTITTLTVYPLAASIASGTVLRLPDGTRMTTSALASASATSISVTSVTVPAMAVGDIIYTA